MADTNYAADFANLFIKGVERAAELQKKALETATQQTVEAIETSKNAAKAVPALPGLFDMAKQAFEQYVAAQKTVIDQFVQQTAVMVETAKESGGSAQKVAADFTKAVQQSIERAVEIEKKVMDLAVESAKTAGAAAKRKE